MSSKNNAQLIAENIRDIQDFPKKGIVFKDITPILSDIDLFRLSIDSMSKPFMKQNIDSSSASNLEDSYLEHQLQTNLTPPLYQ